MTLDNKTVSICEIMGKNLNKKVNNLDTKMYENRI